MIKDFVIALGNYKKYGELLKRRGLHVTGYIALLLLVCSIGLIIIPTLVMGSRTVKVLWEDIPAFTITEQGLEADGEFNLELSGVKIFATDERELSESELGDNLVGILMDKDTVIIRNLGRSAEFAYSEFGENFTVTKNDLQGLKPFLYIYGIILYIMLYITNIISYLMNGLFIGAVASVIAIFMGIRMPVGKYISIAMYSQTLPYVLAAIMLPFGIGMIQPVMFAISISIIVLFFRNMRMEAIPEQIDINPGEDIN